MCMNISSLAFIIFLKFWKLLVFFFISPLSSFLLRVWLSHKILCARELLFSWGMGNFMKWFGRWKQKTVGLKVEYVGSLVTLFLVCNAPSLSLFSFSWGDLCGPMGAFRVKQTDLWLIQQFFAVA
ncbi:hypothetical protein NC652_029441 [Populus alba x Populus x berolinensis]|nr:hypothetical protein NC652_029441 [Populus alba x Populus x berolinensis]